MSVLQSLEQGRLSGRPLSFVVSLARHFVMTTNLVRTALRFAAENCETVRQILIAGD
jgi:hypothetical protein